MLINAVKTSNTEHYKPEIPSGRLYSNERKVGEKTYSGGGIHGLGLPPSTPEVSMHALSGVGSGGAHSVKTAPRAGPSIRKTKSGPEY